MIKEYLVIVSSFDILRVVNNVTVRVGVLEQNSTQIRIRVVKCFVVTNDYLYSCDCKDMYTIYDIYISQLIDGVYELVIVWEPLKYYSSKILKM